MRHILTLEKDWNLPVITTYDTNENSISEYP